MSRLAYLRYVTTLSDTSPSEGILFMAIRPAGGLLIKGVGAVEFLHLNMDRFKDAKRASDPPEEDRFVRDFK